MDKGIRPFAKNLFATLNEKRIAGEFGTDMKKANTAFRKECIAQLMSNFGITLASAATHYNTAFIDYKAATPEKVEGLGRPEDKKGGRKSNAEKAAQQRAADEASMTMGYKDATSGNSAEAVSAAFYPPCPESEYVTTTKVDEAPAEQTVFKVCKKSDGSVVAEGLSFEDAKAMVEKAAAAKKAKLYWI